MSAGEDIGSSEKRQKLENHETEPDEGQTSILSCLERVPLEILAEILSYANSPQDILSVTRCSKHLCTTLLNPSNVMIWRRARTHCAVSGLPPPMPRWSESAYAAFIFDPGNCYICHIPTRRMFTSFVARVRLCGNNKCRNEFFGHSKHVVFGYPLASFSESKSRFFLERLKYLETPLILSASESTHYCLLSDLNKTTAEFEEMTARGESQVEYLRVRKSDIDRQHQILEHAKKLYQWSVRWRDRYRAAKASNVAFARKLAKSAGWNLLDLRNAPTYSSLHRSYNTCLETIPDSAVRLLIAKIDAEIVSQIEKKERRQKAHSQQMRRADISCHRDRLAKEKNHAVVPVQTEFRRLPIIKALQDRDDAPPLSDTVRSSAKPAKSLRVLESELKHSELIRGMIDSDLKKWTDTTRAAFDSILGRPNWKSASTRFLRPSERVTARFICTLCSNQPKKGTTVESLTFLEACAHRCPRHSRKTGGQTWKIDQFGPDKKAISVLSRAISLLKLKVEFRETKDKVENVGPRFICKSCDSPIFMDFQRLAGHSHRHDAMEIGLASTTDRDFLSMRVEHPYDVGSFARYTSKTKEAKEMRQMKTFGCRHCLCRSPELESARPSQNGDNNRPKRFTLDGLISHAKEKHKIFPLGDEDFFRDNPAVADDVEQA